MSDNFDPIDSLIRDLKGNTRFLNKLLFPKVSLIVGTAGILVAIVLMLK